MYFSVTSTLPIIKGQIDYRRSEKIAFCLRRIDPPPFIFGLPAWECVEPRHQPADPEVGIHLNSRIFLFLRTEELFVPIRDPVKAFP